MQEEIDLGKYVQPIISHYRIGLLLFAVVAVIIVSVQFVVPRSYQATATLFAAAQQNQWRFDSRLASNSELGKNWAREFLELAKDAWLKEQIAEQISPETNGELNGTVWVGNRQTLIHVQAVSSTPERAADLANRWSLAYISWVDKMYGTASTSDPILIELEEANKVYQKALQELKTFQASTGIGIAAEGQTMLEGYEWLGPKGLELAEKNRILASHRVALANLKLLQTQFQAAKQAGQSLKDLPWQLLDVNPITARGQLTPQTAVAQSANPQVLEALLATEIAVQTQATAALEDDVSQNQKVITDLIEEFDRLVQERIMQRENYTTFRRKVDEIQYQSKIENVELRMLAPAEPPTEPLQAISWPVVAFLALCGGAIAGIAGCYVAEFVNNRRQFS
jgi:uncharacterized protein involved in exopolysaccharide biosynthesis